MSTTTAVETKFCNDCKRNLPFAEFYTFKSSRDGKPRIASYCKVCWGARSKSHREGMTSEQRLRYDQRHRTPEAIRARNLKRYGLTPDKYAQMLRNQGGVCKLCFRLPKDKPLSVDHDHSCCGEKRACGECRRGLLCSNCNWLLGLAEDRVDLLARAILYLRRDI